MGAPKGNENALKHGAYSSSEPPADLDARIADLDRKIQGLSDYIEINTHDLEPDGLIRLLHLHGQLTSRIGRLMRDRQQLGGDETDTLTQIINAALDRAAEELGIEL